jgi:hypothetical protein
MNGGRGDTDIKGAVGKGYGSLVGEKWGRGYNLYLTTSVGSLTLYNPAVAILTTSFKVKIRFYFSRMLCACVFIYFLRI